MTVQGHTHPTALQLVHFPLGLSHFEEEAWEKTWQDRKAMGQVFPWDIKVAEKRGTY